MRLADLVRFHTQQKLLLLAHSPAVVLELGRLVAFARTLRLDEVAARYRQVFATALATQPTRGRHVNTLQHIAGYVRDVADDESRRALEASLIAYQEGRVPLEIPIGRIIAIAKEHRIHYLLGQTYLDIYRHPSSTTSKSPAVSALKAGFN